MVNTFLGAPLSPSFSIQSSRSLPDLFLDLTMQTASIPMLYQTYFALKRVDDITFFCFLCLNRVLSLFETLLLLFIDNSGTNFLIYFSLTRSFLRHVAFILALGYILQRRLFLVTNLKFGQVRSHVILGTCILCVVGCVSTVAAFLLNGIHAKSVGDNFIKQNPRARAVQLQKVISDSLSPTPSILWQVMHAIALPLVQFIHIGCDIHFYLMSTHGHYTEQQYQQQSKTDHIWIAKSWPYLLSITLHINYIIITILSRAILTTASLGFVMELGQICAMCDWYVFFIKTLPSLQNEQFTGIRRMDHVTSSNMNNDIQHKYPSRATDLDSRDSIDFSSSQMYGRFSWESFTHPSK